MTATPLAVLGIAVMVLALLLIPIGLPGTWIMVLVLGVGAYFGVVGVPIFLGCIALALLAELAEYCVAQRVNVRYGGSRRAFWGAVLGGFIGVFIGLPVPIVGSIVAGVLGSFAGAFVVSYSETRRLVAAEAAWGGEPSSHASCQWGSRRRSGWPSWCSAPRRCSCPDATSRYLSQQGLARVRQSRPTSS